MWRKWFVMFAILKFKSAEKNWKCKVSLLIFWTWNWEIFQAIIVEQMTHYCDCRISAKLVLWLKLAITSCYCYTSEKPGKKSE